MARGGRRKTSRGLRRQWRGSAWVVSGVGAGAVAMRTLCAEHRRGRDRGSSCLCRCGRVRGPSSLCFGKSAPGTVMILVGSFEDCRRRTEIEQGRPPEVCHLSEDRRGGSCVSEHGCLRLSAPGAIVSIGLSCDGRRSRDQCDNDGETFRNCSAKKIDRDTVGFPVCPAHPALRRSARHAQRRLENHARIEAHNAARGERGHVLAHNDFSDLTADEFRRRNFLGEYRYGVSLVLCLSLC